MALAPDQPLFWSLLAVALALMLAAGLTHWLARTGARWARILDHPNARSLHRTPVPRTGGLALGAGAALGLTLLVAANDGATRSPLPWIGAAAVLVGALAFVDDWRGVARRWRLAAQGAAAVAIMFAGLLWDRSWWPGAAGSLSPIAALPLTFLFVVWMINLYNFMDGMDGFAASMALCGFGALAILGWRAEDALFAAASAVIAAAALGFLTGNFPPARIFLGDLGSSLLGLLAAALILWGARDGLFPLWAGALAFAPFIVDATWTLTRRALAGEPVWEAHRSHHYQRLVLAGWSHRKTLLHAWPLMAGGGACAIAAPRLAPREQWLVLFAWLAIHGLVHLRVRRIERAATRLS